MSTTTDYRTAIFTILLNVWLPKPAVIVINNRRKSEILFFSFFYFGYSSHFIPWLPLIFKLVKLHATQCRSLFEQGVQCSAFGCYGSVYLTNSTWLQIYWLAMSSTCEWKQICELKKLIQWPGKVSFRENLKPDSISETSEDMIALLWPHSTRSVVMRHNQIIVYATKINSRKV